MTTSGPGGDTPTANLAEKTQRRDRGAMGGKRATVNSHAGWVNNQSPACSRWCLLEYKLS